MPKYEIHVSQSALHVWSKTMTIDAESEDAAVVIAENKMSALEGKDLQSCDDGHHDYNVQVESCKLLPEALTQ